MVNNGLDPHGAVSRAAAGFVFAMIAAVAVTLGLYLALGENGSIERALAVYGPGVGIVLFALRWCWVTLDADRAHLHYQEQQRQEILAEEQRARIEIAKEQTLSRVRIEEERARAALQLQASARHTTTLLENGKTSRVFTMGPARTWTWILRNGEAARGDIIDGLVQLYGRDGDMRKLLRDELGLQFTNGSPAKAVQALMENEMMRDGEDGPDWVISQPDAHSRVDEMYKRATQPRSPIADYWSPAGENESGR